MSKVCNVCGGEKPLDAFRKKGTSVRNQCRSCENARRTASRDHEKEAARCREYYARNREAILAREAPRQRAYRLRKAADPVWREARRKRERDARRAKLGLPPDAVLRRRPPATEEEKRERNRGYAKAYRLRHPGEGRSYIKAYRLRHPERFKESCRKQGVRKRELLTRAYLANNYFNTSVHAVPEALIDAKRLQIQIKRTVKELTK